MIKHIKCKLGTWGCFREGKEQGNWRPGESTDKLNKQNIKSYHGSHAPAQKKNALPKNRFPIK